MGELQYDWSGVDLTRFKIAPSGEVERERRRQEEERKRAELAASGEAPTTAEKFGSAASAVGQVGAQFAASVPTAAARTLERAVTQTRPSRFASLSPRESPSLAAQRARDQVAPLAPTPQWARGAIDVLDELARGTMRDAPQPDPRLQDSFLWTTLPQAAASAGLFVATGVAGGALGLGEATAAGGAGALMESGADYMEAEARLAPKVARGEITPEDAHDRAFGAWFGGLGIGSSEAIPLKRMFGRLDELWQGGVSRVLKDMFLESAEESAQEAMQGLAGNALMSQLTGDEIDLLDGVKEGAGAGAIIGAVLSLAFSGHQRQLAQSGLAPEGVQPAAAQSSQAAQLAPLQAVPGTENMPLGAGPTLPAATEQAQAASGAQPVGVPEPAGGSPGPVPTEVGTPTEVRTAEPTVAPRQEAVETLSTEKGPADTEPAVRRFAAHVRESLAAQGEEISDADEEAIVASARPAEGLAGRLARAFGAQAVTVEGRGVKPLPLEGMYRDRTIVLDRTADEPTRLRQVLAHELWGHHGRQVAEEHWTQIRDDLEAQFPDLMAEWKASAESAYHHAGKGLTEDEAREESVAFAAEEAAGFTIWALSNRNRLETLLTQARKEGRPTFMQHVLELLKRALGFVPNASRQLELLAREIGTGAWERANPQQAAELASRFVKLADSMMQAAASGSARTNSGDLSALPEKQQGSYSEEGFSERRQAAQPVEQERRARPHNYAEALGQDIAQGRAQDEEAIARMEREADQLPEDVTGGAPAQALNPFREKATKARELADRLNKPTAHEAGMAQAFPLGAGFGRGNLDKKADASIARAKRAVEAANDAGYWEAKADAFDRGEINAQGRRWSKRQEERSNKRAAAKESREQRIAEAKARIEGKERWEVSGEDWATAHGYLGGFDRKQILSEHAEIVEKARAEGKLAPESTAPQGEHLVDQIKAERKEIDPATSLLLASEDPLRNLKGAERSAHLERVFVPLLKLAPEEFQYKGRTDPTTGMDPEGPLAKLKSREEFSDVSAGAVLVYRRTDGQLAVVDGHQRVNAAKRLGVPEINAFVINEADGVTPLMARNVGALINMRAERGRAVDAAQVLRDLGIGRKELRSLGLNPGNRFFSSAEALAELADPVFSQVLNETLPETHGAAIGRAIPKADEQRQLKAAEMVRRTAQSEEQADSIARQVAQSPTFEIGQESMFGGPGDVKTLIELRSELEKPLLAELKRNRGFFARLAKLSGLAETAGQTQVDVEAATGRSQAAESILELVQRFADRRGTVVNRILNDAAARIGPPHYGKPAELAREVAGQLAALDWEHPETLEDVGAGAATPPREQPGQRPLFRPAPSPLEEVAAGLRRRRAGRFAEALSGLLGLQSAADIQLESVPVATLRRALRAAGLGQGRTATGQGVRARAAEILQGAMRDVGAAITPQTEPPPVAEPPAKFRPAPAPSEEGLPKDKRGEVWFSAVRRSVDAMPQARMSNEQARAWLGKQPGVTAEELDYLGLPEWLASRPQVTQDELREYVDAHQVRVEETEKSQELVAQGYGGSSTQYARYTLPGGENYRELLLTWNPPSAKLTPEQETENRAAMDARRAEIAPIEAELARLQQELVAVEARSAGDIRLSEIPPLTHEERSEELGDSLYFPVPDPSLMKPRALGHVVRRADGQWFIQQHGVVGRVGFPSKEAALDTLREIGLGEAKAQWRDSLINHANIRIRNAMSAMSEAQARHPLPHKTEGAAPYQSSHWSTPNVLAHLRTKDRVTAQGEPTLFVEEVQSDWHQAGRDEGYNNPALAEEARRAQAALAEVLPEFRAALRRLDLLGFDWLQQAEEAIYNHPDFRERWDIEQAEIPILEHARLLMWARTQADRAARSAVPDAPFKQTWGSLALKRAIKWAVDHGKTAIAWTTGTQQADRWNQNVHENIALVAIDDIGEDEDGRSARVRAWTVENEDSQRADWSERVNLDTGQVQTDIDVSRPLEAYVGSAVAGQLLDAARRGEELDLSGLDLTIGAEGFRYFYDQALVQAANKLGKRYGAKVETVWIEGGGRDGRTGDLQAHGFRIPPAMAETIREQGFSTFADKFRPRNYTDTGSGSSSIGRDEGFWGLVNRRIMAEFRPVERAQEALEATGVEIPPEQDVSQAHTLFPGKRAEDVRAIRQVGLKVKNLLRKAGIALDDFDDYLRALHAPQRNELMAKRHPGSFDPLFQPGAGATSKGERLTPWVIGDILDRVNRDPNAETYRRAADLIHKNNADALQQRVDQGLLSEEGAEEWRRQFGPYYVPLRSEEEAGEGQSVFAVGGGFQVPKKLSKRAEGRYTASGSPTVWSLAQAEEVASWARRNEVALAMADMIRQNPIPELWRISDEPELSSIVPGVGGDTKQEAVRFKERGADRYMVFQGDQGLQIARTLKKLDTERAGLLTKLFGPIGRFYTQLFTQWNPEFLLRNLVKDVPTAAIRTAAVQGFGSGARVAAHVPSAIRGARSVLQAESAGKDPPSGYWQDLYQEFRRAGAQTGYASMFSYDQRAEQFVEALERGNVAELARGLRDAYFNLQSAVEVGTRLSVYKVSRDNGMSERDAAEQARTVTVDFNRKGELTPALNAIWWFFNPSIQGTRMVGKTLATPRGAVLGGSIIALAYALAHLNRWLGDEDDHNRADEVSDWVKDGYLQVLLPDVVTVKIPGTERVVKLDRIMVPLPWGYSMLYTLGTQAGEVHQKASTVTESLPHVLSSAAESFNPMGATPSLTQLISPSLTDPLVQVGENLSWSGARIRPENPFGQKAPSAVYWPDVNEQARAFSAWLNRLGGGNKREPGAIGGIPVSVSPEDIEHLVESYTGGGGQFLKRSIDFAQDIVRGEETPTREIPFVRSFVSEPDTKALDKQFHRALRRVKTTDQVARLDAETPQRPELLGLVDQAKEFEKAVEDAEDAGQNEAADELKRQFLGLYRKTLSP